MKIASWNIEWMNRWFTSDSEVAAWREPAQISGVTDIQALAARVASVITAIDPDVLLIQEGPSRASELQLFIDGHLPSYRVIGPSGAGQQKLYALVRDGVVATRVFANGAVDLEEDWSVDIDGVITDGRLELEQYGFTRDPLILDAGDPPVRLINLHLKSKHIHGGAGQWANPATRPGFVVAAVRARRRISAEAFRIREYLNELLTDEPAHRVIVAGDLNDGPGADFFERHYMTHNLVSAIAGNPFQPRRMFRHGFADRVNADDNYTAIFDDFVDEIDNRRVLLDHILVSPGLNWQLTGGGIAHAEYEAQVDGTLPGHRERAPSDHRPSWVEW